MTHNFNANIKERIRYENMDNLSMIKADYGAILTALKDSGYEYQYTDEEFHFYRIPDTKFWFGVMFKTVEFDVEITNSRFSRSIIIAEPFNKEEN